MKEANDDFYRRITEVLGEEHVTNDPDRIDFYSEDQSFTPPMRPRYCAFPEKTSEVQEIVKLANEYTVPVIPRSSPVSLYGAPIPTEGGIVLDLKRMNRIHEVNERNWHAIIEPGVSFLALQKHLNGLGFRVAPSFIEPPSASVVSTYMERSPVVTGPDFVYGSEHIISYTVVAPTGETFTVGHPPLRNTPASAPDGPGLNFYRLFQGAQGTLGIVTWMVIRILPFPKSRKVLYLPASSVEQSIEIMSRIQEKELGLECFALNDFNISVLLLEEENGDTNLLKEGKYIGRKGATPWNQAQKKQFDKIRSHLPPWTVIVSLSAVGPIPDEKIAYQELDLKDVMAEIGIEPQSTLSDFPEFVDLIKDELILPWRMQRRFGFRGSCHQVMFYSNPTRVKHFHSTLTQVACKHHYSLKDIGAYLLPLERARSYYCSYDFHCDLKDHEETHRVRALYEELGEVLLDQGAFFDRPYGSWAESVYRRTGTYTKYLKEIKNTLDPNHIMNPGKLCF